MKGRIVTAITLVVSSIVFVNAATAEATASGKQPFSGFFALCGPAEVVHVEGWTETVTNTVFDQAGGAYLLVKTQVHGFGEGLETGTPYILNDSFKQVLVSPTGGGEVATTTRRIQLISQGPMLNAYIWIDFHYTIGPNGTLIVGWSDYAQDCF